MDDAVGVGVLQGLADLADDRQLGTEGDALRLGCEPEVEPLPGLVVGVGEPDAELAVDDVADRDEAVVVEAAERAQLMGGELEKCLAGQGRCPGWGDLEPDTHALLGGDVLTQPVLPTGPGVDRPALDSP